MEAYLIENPSILSLDCDNFVDPSVVCDELPLRNGRASQDKDGRIDLLTHYKTAEMFAVIELKKGEIGLENIDQLRDYLKEREQVLNEIKNKKNVDVKYLDTAEQKWMGLLVGTSISSELIKFITDGNELDVGNGSTLPLAALTIKRFKSDDNQYFVITDTYFNSTKSNKDLSKYNFNNVNYGKGRLVLAVLKEYVVKNPTTTYEQLKTIFSDRIQGAGGVFASRDKALSINANGYVRYFAKDDELLTLSDEIIAVSSQWGIGNIDKFIIEAKKLGFKIS